MGSDVTGHVAGQLVHPRRSAAEAGSSSRGGAAAGTKTTRAPRAPGTTHEDERPLARYDAKRDFTITSEPCVTLSVGPGTEPL